MAADLDHGWDDFLQGARTPDNEEFAGEELAEPLRWRTSTRRIPDNEEFAGEELAGCMLAAPIL